MKFNVFLLLLCLVKGSVDAQLSSDEIADLKDSCCSHGESFAMSINDSGECGGAQPPEDLEPEQIDICVKSVRSCCQDHFRTKGDCTAGQAFAPTKRCSVPKTDIGKTCCEECSFGRWTGETQGKEACTNTADEYDSPSARLRKDAYHKCCLEAAEEMERTTTERIIETTTEKKIETTTRKRESCKSKNPCEQVCNDSDGVVKCQCNDGYKIQADQKSCKDINECGESLDELCPEEGTVCHNTPGSFKCVPIRKREVTLNCPPGFKRNIKNQVCDDINECQLPRPPCAKFLCENTIGGYKCAGKPGKPVIEAQGPTTESLSPTSANPNTNMCPPGFRDGTDGDCVDIDECEERLDDCQRLSQHCINTHGNFFCQDHVSKRCAPGFALNKLTGICEDINECEENQEVCHRTEVCINLPGAYNCKSKISTLPKLNSKNCQEGTRLRNGICEDIDECREGTHLCDQFQDCINAYGGHECRCKSGFEVDSASGSCVDIDECALDTHNCGPEQQCLNVIGNFACTKKTTSTSTSTTHSPDEYEYYYTDDEYEEDDDPKHASPSNRKPAVSKPQPAHRTTQTTRQTTTSTTTLRPATPKPTMARPPPPPPRPATVRPTTPRPTTPRPTTPRPTTPRPAIRRPTRPPPTTQRTTTTPEPTTPKTTTTTRRTYNYNPYPSRPYYPAPTVVPTYQPLTNRPPSRNYPQYPPAPEPPTFTEIEVPPPEDPNTIEKKKDENGTVAIDVNEIPKNKWTNVVGRDPDFDINNLHCLNGYEKNERGECVDTDECLNGNHICSNMEECINQPGGYSCECMAGFEHDPTGWCVAKAPPTTPSTTTTSTTSTTMRIETTPRWTYTPPPPRPRWRPNTPHVECELGFEFDYSRQSCVDIDECATGRATCAAREECHNFEGGYRCVCGAECRSYNEPSYRSNNEPNYLGSPHVPSTTVTNVITVGSQYGQRGPQSRRPSYTRLGDSGAIHIACPWGYKLTHDKWCLDVDECSTRSSQCGPQQTCQNFFGGYSCQCPAGHKLRSKDSCEDINECEYGKVCSINAECINTIGSYRCKCKEGFKNAQNNDKVCIDVDECTEQPGLCQQTCINTWGGHRCACNRGYQLARDNSTCMDIDECAIASSEGRGKICHGECVNVPGSYRCSCPPGYRTAEDGRSCIDIDECEMGTASCATNEPGVVCQNTRGSYHCHRIECPPGYSLEAKHVCKRIQKMCPITDLSCLRRPSSYTYNFITFISNIYLPAGSLDLFTIHGPMIQDAIMDFNLELAAVQAAPHVRPAGIHCFHIRPSQRQCVIALICSLEGPQVIELDLSMSVYQQGQFIGSMVAKIIVLVSKYSF